MILSTLAEEQLQAEISSRPWPKWSTLCTLRLLGLATLDASLVPAGSAPERVRHTCKNLASLHGLSQVLLRSDATREKAQYFRGGDSLPLSRAIDLAIDLLRLGRSIIFMEPTNRFANQLSISCRITVEGQLDIEVLGPGYDVSDLSRGGVAPQLTAAIQIQSWKDYMPLWPFDIATKQITTVSEEQRRLARLKNIGKFMLPNMGLSRGRDPAASAEIWLREMGFIQIWDNHTPLINFKVIKELYDAAFLVASWYDKLIPWRCLCLTASRLSDGRFIYWDVVNADTKFGL